jgi:hypothetical protein
MCRKAMIPSRELIERSLFRVSADYTLEAIDR